MTFFDDLVQASAKKWDTPIGLARRLFWLPIVASLIVLACAFNRELFRWLLQEDGPVEWLTALAFAGAGIVALKIGLRQLGRNRRWQGILFGLVALTMFFAAGEEVSWGQRLFGWDTPDELIEINDQNETTLHNIGGFLLVTNAVMLLVGLYGSVAYLANRRLRVERFWDLADYLFVPPFFLSTYYFPIFVFRLLRFTLLREGTFALNRTSEWVEALVAVGILIFLWMAFLRVSSLRPAPPSRLFPSTNREHRR